MGVIIKNLKKILLFSIFLLLLCSLTAINASNNTITDDNQVISTDDYQAVQPSKSINKQNTIKSETK